MDLRIVLISASLVEPEIASGALIKPFAARLAVEESECLDGPNYLPAPG